MGEGGGSSQGFISPGLGIVKSWQGIVELILRGVTIVSSGPNCQAFFYIYYY
jgi:hypothetical protein